MTKVNIVNGTRLEDWLGDRGVAQNVHENHTGRLMFDLQYDNGQSLLFTWVEGTGSGQFRIEGKSYPE